MDVNTTSEGQETITMNNEDLGLMLSRYCCCALSAVSRFDDRERVMHALGDNSNIGRLATDNNFRKEHKKLKQFFRKLKGENKSLVHKIASTFDGSSHENHTVYGCKQCGLMDYLPAILRQHAACSETQTSVPAEISHKTSIVTQKRSSTTRAKLVAELKRHFARALQREQQNNYDKIALLLRYAINISQKSLHTLKLLSQFQPRSRVTHELDTSISRAESEKLQFNYSSLSFSYSEILMQLEYDFPGATHTTAINWTKFASNLFQARGVKNSPPSAAGNRFKQFLKSNDFFSTERPEFFSPDGVWPCCGVHGPSAVGCTACLHSEEANTDPSLVIAFCRVTNCHQQFLQDGYNIQCVSVSDLVQIYNVQTVEVVIERVCRWIELATVEDKTSRFFPEAAAFHECADSVTHDPGTLLNEILCSVEISTQNTNSTFLEHITNKTFASVSLLFLLGVKLFNIGGRKGCLQHTSSYKAGAKSRASRSKVKRILDTGVTVATLPAAERFVELKRKTMNTKVFEFSGEEYKLHLGATLSVPHTRIKREKNGDYVLSDDQHCGLSLDAKESLKELVESLKHELVLKSGGETEYMECSKQELISMLRETGYPCDDTVQFRHPQVMTKLELVRLVIEAHSTLLVKLWGDHGPIDGKSHVLFLLSVRYFAFQFQKDADHLSLYKRLESMVKYVFVCRMPSDLGVTLGAINTVGKQFERDLMRFAVGDNQVKAKLRWSSGDLKWLAGCAFVQCGGNGPNSCPLPTSPLPRKDFTDYAKGSLIERRSLSGSANVLSLGPFGRVGYNLKKLTAEELREEAKQRGIAVNDGNGRKRKRCDINADLGMHLRGLNQLNGYGGSNPEVYQTGGYLCDLEMGCDPMHSTKGLYSDMIPALLKIGGGKAEKDFQQKREELGTRKGVVRAVDRRKELSHHASLFAEFPDDVRSLMSAFAMLSQLSYTPDKDRSTLTVLAYSTYAYQFHSIMTGKYKHRLSGQDSKSCGNAFGMYYAGLVYELSLQIKICSPMSTCCEREERQFGQYKGQAAFTNHHDKTVLSDIHFRMEMTRILRLIMREDEAQAYITHHASMIKSLELYDVTLPVGSDDMLAFFMLNAEYVTCHSEWFVDNGDGTITVKLEEKHICTRRVNCPNLINDFWYNKNQALQRSKALWHEVLECDGCVVPGFDKSQVERRLEVVDHFRGWRPSPQQRLEARARIQNTGSCNHYKHTEDSIQDWLPTGTSVTTESEMELQVNPSAELIDTNNGGAAQMNGSAENPSHVMLDFAVHDESVSRDLISEADDADLGNDSQEDHVLTTNDGGGGGRGEQQGEEKEEKEDEKEEEEEEEEVQVIPGESASDCALLKQLTHAEVALFRLLACEPDVDHIKLCDSLRTCRTNATLGETTEIVKNAKADLEKLRCAAIDSVKALTTKLTYESSVTHEAIEVLAKEWIAKKKQERDNARTRRCRRLFPTKEYSEQEGFDHYLAKHRETALCKKYRGLQARLCFCREVHNLWNISTTRYIFSFDSPLQLLSPRKRRRIQQDQQSHLEQQAYQIAVNDCKHAVTRINSVLEGARNVREVEESTVNQLRQLEQFAVDQGYIEGYHHVRNTRINQERDLTLLCMGMNAAHEERARIGTALERPSTQTASLTAARVAANSISALLHNRTEQVIDGQFAARSAFQTRNMPPEKYSGSSERAKKLLQRAQLMQK